MGPATISFLDRVDREPEATKLQLVRRFMENDPLSFFMNCAQCGPSSC